MDDKKHLQDLMFKALARMGDRGDNRIQSERIEMGREIRSCSKVLNA